MLLRALFWVTLVAVLMPREPDLGLGRPGHTFDSSGNMSMNCGDRRRTCETVLGFVDTFQDMALRSLARVKADIAQDKRRSLHTEDD